MKIVQLITDTDRRGAQVFATDLGHSLSRLGHDVTTVAMVPGRGSSTLDVPTLAGSRRSPGLYAGLGREARHADVVVAHGSSTLVSCALSVWSTPFVYRQISDPVFWAGRSHRRLRVAAYLRRAAHVVALSDATRCQVHDLFGVPNERITVIPNGIDPRRVAPDTSEARRSGGPDRLHVLTVNALVPEKGTDLVIEATASLPDVELMVAGDGPEREDLEAMARARARGRVTFYGQVDSVSSLLDWADVVVLASRGGDSMPATLVEAGFRGIPVISTDVGSITEIVADGDTGRIVDLSEPGSLEAAISEMSDPVVRERLGAAARTRCERTFDIDVVARAWERVLVDASGRALEPDG